MSQKSKESKIIPFFSLTFLFITISLYKSTHHPIKKNPHLRGLFIETLVFSVVAGEGFEPPTFGL